ncbi:helix-turn-helix domain-containing protein [Deltaproteobacteria bacterium OttesenSCG-928-M10]|nr:helix-turn-helix domain-containing protein [Deltaproteobacteria bacterium OttesenSCG-928-M10]
MKNPYPIVTDLYSIGETARLLGVTTQTLRFYDKCGILSPKYVDKKTGYRFYSFEQFQAIDRIKYLQTFGLPLDEIREIIHSGTVDKLLEFLRRQREKTLRLLEEARATLDTMDWYIDYFSFHNQAAKSEGLYRVHLPERHAMAVECRPDDIPISKAEVRLAQAKASPELKHLSYLRQYAFQMDYDQLEKKEFRPLKYFIYLKGKPDIETEHYWRIPAGEFLCFRARILTESWDVAPLKIWFADRSKPTLVIANEFEDNFVEFVDNQYEVQMLI